MNTTPTPDSRTRPTALLALIVALMLAACSSTETYEGSDNPRQNSYSRRNLPPKSSKPDSPLGREVVMYAMGLMETGYRFGGKNPEAGLDCSGLVTYVYKQAIGVHVPGRAADIAKRGRVVEAWQLRPGDLVFFNTMQRSYSHVGIYIGDNRFIHAPNSRGAVRIERMNNSYYAQRFEEARTYFD